MKNWGIIADEFTYSALLGAISTNLLLGNKIHQDLLVRSKIARKMN